VRNAVVFSWVGRGGTRETGGPTPGEVFLFRHGIMPRTSPCFSAGQPPLCQLLDRMLFPKLGPSLSNQLVSAEKKNPPLFLPWLGFACDKNLPTSWRFVVREVDKNLARAATRMCRPRSSSESECLPSRCVLKLPKSCCSLDDDLKMI
jgi:hypothetical protein